MNWYVDIEAPVRADWLGTRPTVQQQAAMHGWLKARELEGAPPIIGYSDDNFPIAEGPNGERIEFTEIAKPLEFGSEPPYGVIAIRHIGAAPPSPA